MREDCVAPFRFAVVDGGGSPRSSLMSGTTAGYFGGDELHPSCENVPPLPQPQCCCQCRKLQRRVATVKSDTGRCRRFCDRRSQHHHSHNNVHHRQFCPSSGVQGVATAQPPPLCAQLSSSSTTSSDGSTTGGNTTTTTGNRARCGAASEDVPEEAPSPLLTNHQRLLSENNTKSIGLVKYGELVILGFNGSLLQQEKGRRRSKFILCRRTFPNGIKKSRHYVVKAPQNTKAILDSQQHSISYTLSRSQAVIVEYVLDESTDMFQIGRSSEAPIDFVVMDTVPGGASNYNSVIPTSGPLDLGKGDFGGYGNKQSPITPQSTISRFACRILVERDTKEHSASIYAAGFDTSRNIFLGEKATKWQQNGEIDGLTTNGILILHPHGGSFCGGGASGGSWREVSVGGAVYGLRESRSAPQKGQRIFDESNILRDGTLIDLCGATLLYRSAEGLAKSPTKQQLLDKVTELNAGRPQCPVGLNTLVIPSKATLSHGDKQPYVYLTCGHVQGFHDWGLQDRTTNSKTCPMCLKVGPVVKLVMGIEPAFYVDCEPPTHAFNPCGHMASERTVKYWSSIPIPHGINGLHAACPFCACELCDKKAYVRLIFQDHCD